MEKVINYIRLSNGVTFIDRNPVVNVATTQPLKQKQETQRTMQISFNRKSVKDYRVVKLAKNHFAVEIIKKYKWEQPTQKIFKTQTKALDWLAERFVITDF